LRGNERFQAADFNFWGVTFARRSGAFYATLATGGQTYLVEGDTASRTIRVVREGVECPGLSPDNRRIAFKRRMPGIRLVWRIHVVDLESGQETELAETRSVDDQVDWLDDGTVIYALPREAQSASASMDVWAVPSDGSGAPRVLVADAESPAVVRPTH
jgi:Tol biopolymer transport system component